MQKAMLKDFDITKRKVKARTPTLINDFADIKFYKIIDFREHENNNISYYACPLYRCVLFVMVKAMCFCQESSTSNLTFFCGDLLKRELTDVCVLSKNT